MLKDSVWWKGVGRKFGMCYAIAGSGAEENRNTSYPLKAGFAQPSGITYDFDSHILYIADSESSSIRKLLVKNGGVSNVIGGDRDPTNLFAYGDKDGKGSEAKLQHPLGVAYVNTNKSLLI